MPLTGRASHRDLEGKLAEVVAALTLGMPPRTEKRRVPEARARLSDGGAIAGSSGQRLRLTPKQGKVLWYQERATHQALHDRETRRSRLSLESLSGRAACEGDGLRSSADGRAPKLRWAAEAEVVDQPKLQSVQAPREQRTSSSCLGDPPSNGRSDLEVSLS